MIKIILPEQGARVILYLGSAKRMPKCTRILVVDDEISMRRCFETFLTREGFKVIVASDAAGAFSLALEAAPEIIIADCMMGEVDGYSLCRSLKSDSRTAAIPLILFSGAYRTDRDQILGLEYGADDFLYKPFSLSVLAARIRSLQRRLAPAQAPTATTEIFGLKLDHHCRTVFAAGRRVRLTRKEFDLLSTLCRSPGRVFSARRLLELVWDYDPLEYNDTHTVEVHVSALRRKLGAPFAARLVHESGCGYKLEDGALIR